MKTRIILLLLVGGLFLFFGCAQQGPPGSDRDGHGCIPSAGYSWCEAKQKCIRSWEENCTEATPLGGDRDEHGCIGSAGYSWCEVKQKCLRTWEEPCVEGSITLDEARAIALGSACMGEGGITDEYMYNENTHTWWFETDIVRQGCSPACVVDELTRTAEINWRCTGLIIPENGTSGDNETGGGAGGTNITEEQLAGLFQIETEEPFGTEGLDTQTPSAQSNSS
ncbi:hypothetical protein H0O02_02160 [Candidatus Micrarchaeota archaeon]|nr:hypothetical protein [Candidatus Micrarchaeota archaeon]